MELCPSERRPKPRWPQPFCLRTVSDAQASPSFEQAVGNGKSFPAAQLILVKLAARTQNSSSKLTAQSDGDRYFHRLVYVGSNRSVGRCLMAALVGNLTSVLNPFDWTLLLNNRLHGCGPVKEIFNRENLARAFGKNQSLFDEAAHLSAKSLSGIL